MQFVISSSLILKILVSSFFFDKTVSAYVCFDLVNSYCVVLRVENSSSSNSGITKIYRIYFFV